MGAHRGRHAARRPVRISPATSRALVTLFSAAVLLATGVSWATVDSLDSDLSTSDVLGPAPEGGNDGDGAMDILLIGNDSRTDARGDPLPLNVLRALRTEHSDGNNTDTIILVRVPDNGTAAHVVSIPRDTAVPIPNSQPDKINSVYQLNHNNTAEQLREQGITDEAQILRDATQAGRRALVKTVQQLTGVRIDHYAEVNLLGFALMTEAIGGIEVCLNEAVNDPGSGADFPAGRQTISGGDALSFVRQRNGLPRGDLDRILRQQVFLASTVQKLLSAGTLTDTERLSGLISAARRSIVLDKEWDILGFAQQMQGVAAGAVDFVTIPVLDPAGNDERGHSVVTADPEQVRTFMADLVTAPTPPEPQAPPDLDEPTSQAPASTTAPQAVAPRDYTVDVLNGTGVDGLAGEVSARLVAADFTAGTIDNTAAREETIIAVAPGREDIGEQVSGLLDGGIPVRIDPSLAGERILVLIGADYPARSGNRLAGPAPLRLDGAVPLAQPTTSPAAVPPPPPISAEGVPCIN